MASPETLPHVDRGVRAGSVRARAARAFRAGLMAAVAALSLVASGDALAQSGRPDTVYRRVPRTGKVQAVTGTVLESTLSTVRLDRGGRETSYSGVEVVRIEWGTVPPSYRDGMTYLRRGDLEQAVASFRTAAGDASAREVVQADARLRAAETLLKWGAEDPGHFAECVGEVDRFLADHPAGREVPQARMVKARALRLSGDHSAAAAGFEALYEQGANEPPTEGYDRVACLDAGLEAAWCYLQGDDTLKAREMFGALEGAFANLAATSSEADPMLLAHLVNAQGEAAAGEGFCLLASDQADDALRFFERKLGAGPASAGERHALTLGLAEAHEAAGQLREAQLAFARTSALDFASADRAARAQLGLARTTLALGDQDSRAQARTLLETLTRAFGDTPSAAPARELLQSL